jgi:hypothetical protein
MTRTARLTIGTAILLAAMATPAAAQYSAPKMTASSGGAVGEAYHIQASGGLWMPDLLGVIASEQFGIAGSKVDFITDLKFQKKNFADLRFELKASKHNKFYAQYTPVSYSSDTTINREFTFNGQRFEANAPLQASFDWKVWRLGYEVDFVALPRGFAGITFEGRLTDFGAHLKVPKTDEFTRAKGPLPAVGFIARGYVLPNLSLTGSISGFKVPNVSKDYQGNYYDLDIYGTFNLNNYIGVQAGWRKMTTTVTIKKDFGDMEYKGFWFGGVVRY